ncbi:MAG: YdeI/OmpD-associated family protein [Candidatus Peribacteraceae bacterium]
MKKDDVARALEAGSHHHLPVDVAAALLSTKDARITWSDITPLARNEWICWMQSAKKEETRAKRIRIGVEQLGAGKRRPCCWQGCRHH